MGPKKLRKIEVTIDTTTDFELGDTAADIERRGEERKQGEVEVEKQQSKEREEAKRSEDTPQKDISQTKETVSGKQQYLTGVTVNWTQRVEERPAEQLLSANTGTKKDI